MSMNLTTKWFISAEPYPLGHLHMYQSALRSILPHKLRKSPNHQNAVLCIQSLFPNSRSSFIFSHSSFLCLLLPVLRLQLHLPSLLCHQASTVHANMATSAATLPSLMLFPPPLLGGTTTKPVCVGVVCAPPQVAPCPGHPTALNDPQIDVALSTGCGPTVTAPPPPPAVNPPPGALTVTPYPAGTCCPDWSAFVQEV